MKHTEETRRKLSALRRGENNPFYGKKHSVETKAKMARVIDRKQSKHSGRFCIAPMKLKSMKDISIAYLAGIIDGEGSISFRCGRPYIAIYGNNDDLMFWLDNHIGGNTLWNVDKRGRVPGHMWHIGAARDVYTLCLWTKPFLVVKRKECNEVLDWLKQKYGKVLDG